MYVPLIGFRVNVGSDVRVKVVEAPFPAASTALTEFDPAAEFGTMNVQPGLIAPVAVLVQVAIDAPLKLM